MSIDMPDIAAWLEPQEILLDVAVRDRFDAVDVLASAIARKHHLESAPIARALWRREQAGSTALGDGFAIPHARIEGISRPLTIFMRTSLRIEFNAPDGKPVADLLGILVPHEGPRDHHLQLLALVAQLFSNREFRRQLDGAPDVATARSLFRTGIGRLAPTLSGD
jgi:PTS system nitrogen regulatory IIA component